MLVLGSVTGLTNCGHIPVLPLALVSKILQMPGEDRCERNP